jgi:pyruvate/2-oxoglutarate/acetoin dehydrogenase E1 component
MSEIHFWRAINMAVDEAMAADDRIVIFGEDVALPGGIYGVTRNLAKTYGEARVWDTPISESAFVGMATGAAMTGLRPIIEIMYMDFTLVAMDQLVNHMAKIRFLSQGKFEVPVVIRTMHGLIPGSSAQHSQTFDAWFAGIPGITVVAPSNPQDAYSLMHAAIESDDPVIFMEHRSMYMNTGEVDTGVRFPIGQAATLRTGDDVTIVCWSKSVQWALDAADQLAAQGVEADVIDLRTIAPLDFDTIARSVTRTARVVVVHEAIKQGGYGGEIVARIVEEIPEAQARRLGSAFAPISSARSLAAAYTPQVDDIVAAALKMG